MGSEKWWTAISKCQCEIVREKAGVFLRFNSSILSVLSSCHHDVTSLTMFQGQEFEWYLG